ncbi:hypothetical protein AM593_01892, partial [Mytilus galloprovincialis]
EPKILDFSPKNGIQYGDTTITIKGSDIGFEGQKRYKISFYDETFPIECSCKCFFDYSTFEDITSENRIKCKTGKSDGDRNMSRLQVVIDDLTVLSLNRTFKYLPDPTFSLSNKSTKAQQSGGATFTIQGEGFNNVGQITVERVITRDVLSNV